MVELGAEYRLFVHARELDRGILRLRLHGLAEDLRGRCHVEPLVGADLRVIVHAHEVRLILAEHTRRAVSLIADDQIDRGEAGILGGGDHVHRLVGGEEHREPLGILALRNLSDEVSGLRCRGIGEIGEGEVFGVASDLVVGADREGAHRAVGFGGPLAKRLREQRDRRNQEQYRPTGLNLPLSDPQAREGLAGATGHDELAAIVFGETVEYCPERFDLMGAELLRLGPLERAGVREAVLRPVNPRLLEFVDADPDRGNLLVTERIDRVLRPLVRRRDDDARGERVFAGGREEGVDVLLVEVVVR